MDLKNFLIYSGIVFLAVLGAIMLSQRLEEKRAEQKAIAANG